MEKKIYLVLKLRLIFLNFESGLVTKIICRYYGLSMIKKLFIVENNWNKPS